MFKVINIPKEGVTRNKLSFSSIRYQKMLFKIFKIFKEGKTMLFAFMEITSKSSKNRRSSVYL